LFQVPPVRFVSISALALLALFSSAAASAKATPPKPGYVLHFDFITNASEGLALVDVAVRGGAKVINLVPPAHIWDSRSSLEALDKILAEISRRHLSLVFTRIDASPLPDRNGSRFNYLYGRILTEPGRMPSGKATAEYFLTTAGREGYGEWMEDETRFYAKRYGKLPNLLGINLGPFSEPDTAQRCGFFEYEDETQRYEITQYTPAGERVWHRWLAAHFSSAVALSREYAAGYASFDAVPLPLNDKDRRFGRADLAYYDFARSLNDWFVERYHRCRSIWHEVSGRNDVPLILQFSGGAAEKFMLGRPGFAAFDLPGWVAMADALGLSVYTNSGFPNMGHASILATLNLIAVAGDMGKDIFVLEGGNEAPNVTLDPVEMAFFGSVAAKVSPRTYIYEFLKDKFDEEYSSNPGKVVTAAGAIRRPAFNALRKLFRQIEARPVAPETPAIYLLFDSMAARGNSAVGTMYAAMYDLAASVPVRWIAKGRESAMRSGIPVLHPDGSATPPNEALSRLMTAIPDVGTVARAEWRRNVLKVLSEPRPEMPTAKTPKKMNHG
jgi:hypothetical protein